jgi:predicted O-methyltransferase YrrM
MMNAEGAHPRTVLEGRGRRHPLFALLGLREPRAQHSAEDEAFLVAQLDNTSAVIVELGVAEGGSAVALARAMGPDSTLHLVDPHFPGRIPGLSMAMLVARKAVRSTGRRRQVRWHRATSVAVGESWTNGPIDLLFVDADHSFDGVSADWRVWSPHLSETAVVVFDDAGPEVPPTEDVPRFVTATVTPPEWVEIEGGRRYRAYSRRATA